MLLKPVSELRPASSLEGLDSFGPSILQLACIQGVSFRPDVSADGSQWWQATQVAGIRVFGLPRQLAHARTMFGEWVWKNVVLEASHWTVEVCNSFSVTCATVIAILDIQAF